jgi:hypothetical protein
VTAPAPVCGARGPNHKICVRPAGHKGGHVSREGEYWQADEPRPGAAPLPNLDHVLPALRDRLDAETARTAREGTL